LGETGSGEIRLEWHGRNVRSRGAIEGFVRLAGGGVVEDGAADLVFDVASTNLGAILSLFVPETLPEFQGSGNGQLSLAGTLEAGRLPAARLRLDDLTIRHSGQRAARTLENLEPVSLALDRGVLDVESFYLATPDGESEFFVAGRIALDGDQSLDLNLQGSLGASWFEPWVPDGIELVEGTFDVIGSVVGTVSEPSLDGVGEFSGGRLVSTGLPATFESTEAILLFYPGQAVLDQLSARVAGGSLDGAGTIGWAKSGELDYRFQVSGDGLNFRYPDGWSIRGDTELTLSSSPGGRQLTGALDLDRALYVTDVPIELDQLLRAYFEQRRVEVEETDELLATTQLNLAVAADETLRIRNNLADLRGSADLVLRGSLARPVVFGTVEFDPTGRLIYSGNEYELERGVLTFANPYRLEPVVDLVAHTGLREYDVTLRLAGTPEQLSFDFISDPPLAELEVMALMTGGRPRDPEFGETRVSQDLQGEELGAESFLYGQATSLVANRFNRLFGLDQFRIVPLTSSTGDLSSARVTVGKQLSRDLFATYSYDPSETEEQIFELEWRVSRSLVLVLTQNGDGTYAADAKWEKVF
jgi:translocation and assembly module TamB